MKQTQEMRILALLRGRPITTADLMDTLHIGQYNARIKGLRDKGYVIESEHLHDSLWQYTIVSEPTGEQYDTVTTQANGKVIGRHTVRTDKVTINVQKNEIVSVSSILPHNIHTKPVFGCRECITQRFTS